MRIIRHFSHCPPEAQHSVIALGNFDGLHRGHQAVIEQARSIAKQANRPSAVMTFEPHPLTVLKPELAPSRLTPFTQKARLLRDMGIDYLFVAAFNNQFRHITADQFVDTILCTELRTSHVVIGHDFIFGYRRQGNAALLKQKSIRHGYQFTQLTSVGDAEAFSSTRIRHLLSEGKVTEANAMLGRNHSVKGRIRKGDQRGRMLGFPTANIYLKDQFRPAFGVYSVTIKLDREETARPAIANFGKRPTFDSAREVLEVHIFNFDADIYDTCATVEFLDFIRPEQQFASVDALKTQIAEDCQHAQSTLQENP